MAVDLTACDPPSDPAIALRARYQVRDRICNRHSGSGFFLSRDADVPSSPRPEDCISSTTHEHIHLPDSHRRWGQNLV